MKFVKANLQETFDAASELGVMAIPTLVFYKDGQEVTRLVGAVPKEKILGAVGQLTA
ncbi:MAG: thioredoxin family protein [Planctomycetota bacterium]